MASETITPSAMAVAVRIDSAVRLRPEKMSPTMISRMALVRAIPGTNTIKVQMVIASSWPPIFMCTKTRARSEAMAAPIRV